MTPPAKRNSRTTALILDAARREFANFGFKKVTMNEIARELDMGKASLYYYFQTKESLFQAVITREYERFMEILSVRMASTSIAREKINIFVRERAEYFNRIVNLNVLDLRTSARMKPVFARMFDSFSKRELDLLRGIILEGRRNGEFEVASEERVARALLHTLQGLRMRFIRLMDSPRIDQKGFHHLKQEERFVTEILLRGIQKIV